ncbi:hypothetical protein MKX03_024595 [Papaver bracteatum]|nr:hypothetical protein MKX03_024595 [Papaver bracteatum]
MDLRQSPRLLKNPSTASPSSSKPTSTASPSPSSKQTNKLISTSFIPPKLKSTPASTTATEKSRVVDAEEPKKKNNAGSFRRLWMDNDEILLLTNMADCVKRGGNPSSLTFIEFIQPKISVDVDVGQIRSKIRHTKDAYLEKEKEEKKGIVLKFKSPHHQECHELSKMVWGSGGGEGSETVVVEEDHLEIPREKKRKSASMNHGKKHGQGKDGASIRKKQKDGNAAATVMEEPEQNNVQVAENHKKGEEGEAKEREAGASDRVSEKLKALADNQEKREEGEAKERNKKKKKTKVGPGYAEPVPKLKASTDNQKEGKHAEKERNGKKKKKRKVGNADSASENLNEQMTKAPLGLESFLDEKTLQLIEPSKWMALQQKWKESRIAEMELFLQRNDLVREGALLVLEALKAPPS